MRSIRSFAIITQNAPPQHCGIGDYSLHLAAALRAAGHPTVVLAREGTPGEGVAIVAGAPGRKWLATVENQLERFGAEHLLLQYTPSMFSNGNWRVERELLRCWQALAARCRLSLIVHETYFRVFWRPASLLRGSVQKAFLKRLARVSHDVFTASQPLRDEMSSWQLARDPVILPIGSNFEMAANASSSLRQRYGIAETELVLALFSGGNSLKWSAGLVDRVEAALNEAGVAHTWLLLGGVPPDWFRLTARVVGLGWLTPADLSMHLQLADVFLVPHASGLSAKRGTLMAALQHGLPVVGTKGPMTDAFWAGAGGVKLVDTSDGAGFASAVLALSRDHIARRDMGGLNQSYFEQHFAWPRIASTLLDNLRTD